jgi:AcrR family transcriptional regulator
MSGVTEELMLSLRKQRREMLKLFASELHPTASSILDEGAKVIIAGGSGALTMRAVAKQARIKLASLQYHFQTFDQLVSALFSREFGFVADTIWQTLHKVDSTALSPAQALRAAVESFMPQGLVPKHTEHTIYFHLMAFSSYNADAFEKAQAFYKFYNTVIAYLVSKVNPSLGVAECIARGTMITSTLEGSCVYTILKAGGTAAEAVVYQEIGTLALHYAALPSSGKSAKLPVS